MEGDGAKSSTSTTTTSARVQHITKASSDELLSKFAQVGGTNNKLALTLVANKNNKLHLSSKRKTTIDRSNTDGSVCESPSSVSVADRKSLLPVANKRASATFIRRIGIGKTKLRSKNLNNKSLLGTIEKTWRKTLKGASKILIEKHYNRHKRLISDIA